MRPVSTGGCNVAALHMAVDSLTQGPGAELRGRQRECNVLDRLIEAARRERSQALVLRGEPGVGKTALLEYLVARASGCRVVRATGVQSEMELPFAGLHQLLAPMLDGVERLPAPQRDAVGTAFGMTPGPAPDRFLLGLAVLGLLADAAEERPLICVVDDEQWLDRASAQSLAFVARRLDAESVVLVFGARTPGEELGGLPELEVNGLREADARRLLESVLAGPLDDRIRDRIVSEARGNPLALLELPRETTPAELAGGFGLPGAMSLSGRLEQRFGHQLDALPPETRRLLQVAVADPVGDPALVWAAAERLAITPEAAVPAIDAGLVEFGARVRFRHPLVRSAAYGSASPRERQDVHRALAEVIDPTVEPDRHAWHRAQATPMPDEDVAAELEHAAGRAQTRGGLAAAAAFLERAAILTPDPEHRSRRRLAAARANRDAGALDGALVLLTEIEAAPLDEHQRAEATHLRGQLAFDQRRGTDAAALLAAAAARMESVGDERAREVHAESLLAAMWADDLELPGGLRSAAQAARAAPPGPPAPRAVDVLVEALALRLTDGYGAAASALTHALQLLLDLSLDSEDARRWLWMVGARTSGLIAMEVWEFESWHTLALRQVQVARDMGALVHLQFALTFLVVTHLLRGELTTAARLIDEDRLIADATGNAPVAHTEMMLAAWRGEESRALELIETTMLEATALGLGRLVNSADHASAVLNNGLGRHDVARDVARRAFERDPVGHGSLVVPELAEAASRTGDTWLVRAALDWLSERTRVTSTGWLLGIEARVRALLGDGDAADRLYRESIDRLSTCAVRAELARTHLLYGEWLRRERRRVDAREQLRIAHEMFDSMGAEAFGERAGRELLATGETARKRTVETRDELTAQEAQIARLARDGLSNPEIGTRLFISPRTVKYHLSKVFTKLNISVRSELERVLPSDAATPALHD
jgi:DNA-binding CsgD family transcriptional regulator